MKLFDKEKLVPSKFYFCGLYPACFVEPAMNLILLGVFEGGAATVIKLCVSKFKRVVMVLEEGNFTHLVQ